MTSAGKKKRLSLEMSANYRISVQGTLDESYFDRLGDMSIRLSKRASQSPVTTLSGKVRDQAQLLGILNALYELHLPLLSVQLFNKEAEK